MSMKLIKYISVLFIAALFTLQVTGQNTSGSEQQDNLPAAEDQLLPLADDIQDTEESGLY
jgi:hypothetical protein